MIDILFEITSILISLAVIAFGLYVIYLLGYSMIRGAPYAPLGQQKIASMISLLQIKPGEKAVDIGAGDGRIVIALAKAGAKAYGYEINPVLIWIARRNIKKAGLQGKAHIYWKDLWKASFSSYSIVTLYGSFPIMKGLQKKLQRELPSNAKVASNYFTFPGWKPSKKKDTVYLYDMKNIS